MDLSNIDTWTDEQVDKVFDYLMDEYTHSEAEVLRVKYVTRVDKVKYLKVIETRFIKYFGKI
jgi:hypothetical protein